MKKIILLSIFIALSSPAKAYWVCDGIITSNNSFIGSESNVDKPEQNTLPAEVCERMRRDGGSVFPALANTGDPNGSLRPVR